ncbi:universal stress protein [Thiomicrorhabdus sediminis]|uniref:Universal stress protein n=1 Tax=Thiomicrorhabdus sediminis TaxID=2580412 RepID=A0A4P9K5D3_9GAMM|nr:universal stress protein [Thiomicrorhabdus sediminis]QCU90179.1 universal stress protein [Thiomicrorhabdus sediminis]
MAQIKNDGQDAMDIKDTMSGDENLLQAADCHYKKIVVAVDFTDLNRCVIAKGLALAKQYQAHLCLLHIVEVPSYPVLEDVAVMGMPGVWDEEMTKPLLDQAQAQLFSLANEFAIKHIELINGLAEEDIVQFAKREHFDLIVIGAHGLSAMSRLIGSTTNAVINHAHCDVLAVRATPQSEQSK